MKRKMTVLLSGTLLVVGMFMANSIADIAHYYTRTRSVGLIESHLVRLL